MSSSPSLLTRLFITVIIGLVAVMGVHLVLSVWLERSVYTTERSRLMSWSSAYVHAWSQADVLDTPQRIPFADITPPDPRFKNERSGIWAVLISDGQVLWASESTPADWQRAPLQSFEFAEKKRGIFNNPERGNFSFSESPDIPHRLALPVTVLPTQAQQLDTQTPSDPPRYLLVVAESAHDSIERVDFLRTTLWWGMFLSLVAILSSQVIAARWTAAPLHRLSASLHAVRTGKSLRLDNGYPKEVEGVVIGFNELLEREQDHLAAHRNSMDNLAHSLKTPLAVLRSAAESGSDESLRSEIISQVARMDRQVSYHLSVAGRQGRAWLANMKSVKLLPIVSGLVSGLEKIYAHKGALCEFVDLEDIELAMEEDDAQEMLGNLLDNAFKWCSRSVIISAQVSPGWVILQIGDDGPGVPEQFQHHIRARGRRADEMTQGHGIGLAAVDDIVSVYSGHLEVGRHEELGGAMFTVKIPRPAPVLE